MCELYGTSVCMCVQVVIEYHEKISLKILWPELEIITKSHNPVPDLFQLCQELCSCQPVHSIQCSR